MPVAGLGEHDDAAPEHPRRAREHGHAGPRRVDHEELHGAVRDHRRGLVERRRLHAHLETREGNSNQRPTFAVWEHLFHMES